MRPFTLVLLPGLDGTGEQFAPLLRELPSTIAPVTVRYPVDRALGYEELLPLALEQLPADCPFVLVGESFSGPLAIRLAAQRPPGLRALVRGRPPNAGGGLLGAWRALKSANRLRRLDMEARRDALSLLTQSAAELLGRYFESDGIQAAFGFDAVVGNFASPYHPGTDRKSTRLNSSH